MRSQNKSKNSANFLVLLLKRCFGCFLFLSILVCFPRLNLLADSLVPNSSKPQQTEVSSPRTKIYFYNPEINTARNLVLKNAWDNYLYEVGHYEFQPVDNKDDFELLVNQEEDSAFIMAEWLYSSIFSKNAKEMGLELAFRGLMNGKDTYQKILVSQDDLIDLDVVTIACSGTKERAREVLRFIYPELSNHQIEKIKILLVPKDIDALMAVGYGLAELALTTEVGLSKMALLNEHVYKDMVVIKESSPLRRSVLVFKSNNIELKASLAKALLTMSKQTNGKQAINLLGLDEWKMVDSLSRLIPKKLMDETNKNGGQNNDK